MNASSFQAYLESLRKEYAQLSQGAVASYIPELLKANPAWFGISVITVDGHVYQRLLSETLRQATSEIRSLRS